MASDDRAPSRQPAHYGKQKSQRHFLGLALIFQVGWPTGRTTSGCGFTTCLLISLYCSFGLSFQPQFRPNRSPPDGASSPDFVPYRWLDTACWLPEAVSSNGYQRRLAVSGGH